MNWIRIKCWCCYGHIIIVRNCWFVLLSNSSINYSMSKLHCKNDSCVIYAFYGEHSPDETNCWNSDLWRLPDDDNTMSRIGVDDSTFDGFQTTVRNIDLASVVVPHPEHVAAVKLRWTHFRSPEVEHHLYLQSLRLCDELSSDEFKLDWQINKYCATDLKSSRFINCLWCPRSQIVVMIHKACCVAITFNFVGIKMIRSISMTRKLVKCVVMLSALQKPIDVKQMRWSTSNVVFTINFMPRK